MMTEFWFLGWTIPLKGSYDVAKKNIILCNAMCLCGLRLQKHIIFHILYIIAALLCSAFLKCVDFYKAHRSEKRGVLWLASYPVRCDWPNTSSVRRKCYTPLPCCDAVSRRDETKTIKPIIDEAFVASSGDIITDYNDLYGLFTHHVTLRCINITMSAFVFVETPNKCYSTLLKTRVWIVSSKFFKYENILTGCESEAPDCSCKVGIAPLYRNSLCASQHCRLLFQVQETILCKMRCTNSNIWVELFWNSVVNTT